jgi:hypothetical protein
MLVVDSDEEAGRLSARSSFGDQVSLLAHYDQHQLLDQDMEAPDLYGSDHLDGATVQVIEDVVSPDDRQSSLHGGRVNMNRDSREASDEERRSSASVHTPISGRAGRRAAQYSALDVLSAGSPRAPDEQFTEQQQQQPYHQEKQTRFDDEAVIAYQQGEMHKGEAVGDGASEGGHTHLDGAGKPASYGAVDASQYRNRFSAQEAAEAASLNEVSVEGMPLLGDDVEPLELNPTKRMLCCSVPHYCGCNWYTIRQIFTWERLKILLILAVTLLAFLMFTSQKEVTLENEWELGAVDSSTPMVCSRKRAREEARERERE